MKRNKIAKLKSRLDLVRETVRQLTPAQLVRVQGGTNAADINALFCSDYTRSDE